MSSSPRFLSPSQAECLRHHQSPITGGPWPVCKTVNEVSRKFSQLLEEGRYTLTTSLFKSPISAGISRNLVDSSSSCPGGVFISLQYELSCSSLPTRSPGFRTWAVLSETWAVLSRRTWAVLSKRILVVLSETTGRYLARERGQYLARLRHCTQ